MPLPQPSPQGPGQLALAGMLFCCALLLTLPTDSTAQGACSPACGTNQTCCAGNCARHLGPEMMNITTTQMCRNNTCCAACNPQGGLPPWRGGTKDQLACAVVAEAQRQGLNLWSHWAYIMGTIQHETGTYKPVRECYNKLSITTCERYLQYLLKPAADNRKWYGRGYVQLTKKVNYQKYEKLMGCPLVDVPDLALFPDVSLYIIVHGMKNGGFTGLRLETFVKETDEKLTKEQAKAARKEMYLKARTVINGKLNKTDKYADKAENVTAYALDWEPRVRACFSEPESVCGETWTYNNVRWGCRQHYRKCNETTYTCKLEPCPTDKVRKCCDYCVNNHPRWMYFEYCNKFTNCSATSVNDFLQPANCTVERMCDYPICEAYSSFNCPASCKQSCGIQWIGIFPEYVCECTTFG